MAQASQPKLNLQLLEQRVDWITCSAPPGDDLISLLAIADAGIARAEGEGDRVSQGGGHGYYTTRAGHWIRALGEQGGYVMVGGHEAAAWCVPLLSIAHHCSRIDYSVTVGYPQSSTGPIPEVARILRRHNRESKKPLTVGLHSDLDRHHGITIGARSSACYGRIYDKHLESKGTYPEGAWRFEVELKRYASEQEHEGILAYPSRCDTSHIVTRAYFARWDIPVPCAPPDATWTALQVRPQHDADRSLAWLSRQVRPTVQWLEALGRGHDVARALARENMPMGKGA